MLRHSISAVLAALLLTTAAGCSPDAEPQVATVGGTPTATPAAVSDVVTEYVEAMRAYVVCVRAEGLKVTDPDPRGRITYEGDLRQLKADPRFIAGQKKCSGLHPVVPPELEDKPVMTAEQIETARRYAKCMRDNGAPDFPDPGPDGYYPDPRDGTSGWNQGTDAAIKAGITCGPVIGHPATPGPAQG